MCERLPLRCLCACQQEVARAVNHQNIAVPRLFSQRMAWRFVLAGGVLDWFLKIFFHFNRCSLT
ncbi:hypothetical protein KP509_27G019700 [Ceratopteris richardii]|uniref:Uncharacterized protein n=1 Tax=Ceratopteris richardii TaxID=49495 RepID=A0A8T2RFR7_CERRI|nr:hypothetical protein KP509_27G019700 [Ceratopteris richardii]